MVRRLMILLLLGVVVASGVACGNKKVKNPLAQVDSKQPDKVLFDRAIEAMKKGKYDTARLSLQTLINTYPDSEYIARAKLAIADSWYAEGGSAALAQAENEYKDFITFFPNMPEAAEAQMKVADIHYKQMEKPDRDYTQAKRAEDEYRQMLLQFPDSPLAPQAKARLIQVQEVLAEREFRIGRFYYMRGSYMAADARLQSLANTYPLYSGADEALFLLGMSWEQQIGYLRNSRLPDDVKNRMIREYTDHAAAAYSKIITRYPVTDRAGDAKAHLAALDRPVPTPTAEAIAMNKAEEESRGHLGKFDKTMLNFKKKPDVSTATKVGDPTLVDPQITSAPALMRQANDLAKGESSEKVKVETVKDDGSIPASQEVPRSDAATPAPQGIGELKASPDASTTPADSTNSTATDGNSNPAPKPAPAQVNEAAGDPPKATTDATSQPAPADPNTSSTSKKKEKKGLRKIIPF
jgi:outer membrane protein assembly factor BamD